MIYKGENEMKKFLVLVLSVILVMGALSTSTSAIRISDRFDDVREDMWYAGSIRDVVEKGLMNGVTERTFGPQLPLTRGMLATIIYRLHGEPDAGVPYFTDVGKDAYYAKPIAWASECGVVNGVSDTEFAPDVNVTREQMITMFYRYCKYIGMNMNARYENIPLNTYSDYKEISGYATDAVKWAGDMGLIYAMDGKFLPRDDSTRAYTSSVLDGVYKRIKNRQ